MHREARTIYFNSDKINDIFSFAKSVNIIKQSNIIFLFFVGLS